jgi:Tfp pilus assembly protein PilE
VSTPAPAHRSRRGGFTLIEMLTVVAALIIVLGLMVSLAWSVRRQSSERLTKGLLFKLDALMGQYVARHKQLPEVAPLVDTTRAATQGAEAELPDEETLLQAAELNNRDFVLALRSEAASAGGSPAPDLFGPLTGSMYDEVTLRDAWGTPIVFMPAMHPAFGMALGYRPFFVSAGPDRKFHTLDDNLYSYEQTAPQPTE